MRNSSKILLGFMLVMMICCVSAVSATDINGTDDALITDDIAIDDVSEIVEEVEIDDASDDVVDEENLRGTAKINNDPNIGNFFDGQGNLKSNVGNTLTFDGDFYNANYNFTNFILNRAVTINANTATLHDMGFELTSSGITLNGATIIMDAPNGANCYAIDVENANNAIIQNNKITYTCNYANAGNYNYVIKVMNSLNVKVYNNIITASLPLKDIDYTNYPNGFPGLSYDKVAGVAVENSQGFNFTKNILNVTGHLRGGYYPTLDALLVINSPESYIEWNEIYENDDVTAAEQTNYLYAVDVYKCNNMKIRNNIIKLNSGSGNLTVNGTGAAYGIQLTGPHTGVVISNNNITTANNGPNLGIYSQSANDTYSSIEIKDNNIDVTGRSGNHPWALVSGIEVQDSNAVITGNTINVHDVSNTHVAGNYLFGISYAQYIGGNHTLNINSNHVFVDDGDYAIYILSGINCNICNNELYTDEHTGDESVNLNRTGNNVAGNY